jgi:hemolysin III
VSATVVDIRFSPREELANALTSGFGMLLSVAALTLMSVSVAGLGALHVISAAVFGGSLIALYAVSVLNHALRPGRAKDFFHILDLCAIYLLIAGTYTPVVLVGLHNRTGYLMFAAIWVLALAGCTRKLISPNTFGIGVDRLSVISFVLMGWIILLAPMQVIEAIPTPGLLWIGAGGVAYTSGLLFFRMRHLRFHHAIWHLFVIAGSACHVIGVYFYVLPIVRC